MRNQRTPSAPKREPPDAGEGSGLVPFVVGFVFGGLIGVGTALGTNTTGGGMLGIIGATAVAGGFLSWRFGERFWRNIGGWLRW